MEILRELYRKYAGTEAESAVAMGGTSGSARRYYRLSGPGGTAVGVIGTVREENAAFTGMSRHFREKGLNVPEVYAVSTDGMAYLQQDLGGDSLYDLVAAGRKSGDYSPAERELLTKTVSKLPDLQFLGAEGMDWSLCYPESEFSRRAVMFDLSYFKYCFLKPSGVEFNEFRLQDDFEALADGLLSCGDEKFMYRDFQARNVMVKDGEPWFIDFQGGRKGPVQYDLASFVWQARARYPEDLRRALVDAYAAALRRHVPDLDMDLFGEKLRLFVLFRTLQVLGAYGFRGLFQRKAHFIESIPFALENLRELLKQDSGRWPYLSGVLAQLASLPAFALPQSSAGGHNAAGQNAAEAGHNAAGQSSAEAGHKAAGQNGAEAGRNGSAAEVPARPPLTVTVISFSYKKGIPADPSGNGGGYVFDCRSVNNPGRYEYYRQFNGTDPEVIKFLEDDGGVFTFLEKAYALVDRHAEVYAARGFTSLQVCFGCTGGQHRSVYCAQHMAEHLAGRPGITVKLIHREMGLEKTF